MDETKSGKSPDGAEFRVPDTKKEEDFVETELGLPENRREGYEELERSRKESLSGKDFTIHYNVTDISYEFPDLEEELQEKKEAIVEIELPPEVFNNPHLMRSILNNKWAGIKEIMGTEERRPVIKLRVDCSLVGRENKAVSVQNEEEEFEAMREKAGSILFKPKNMRPFDFSMKGVEDACYVSEGPGRVYKVNKDGSVAEEAEKDR